MKEQHIREKLLIFILISVVIVSNVTALNDNEINLGPKLQILDASKKEVDISKPILNDRLLSFKLILTNQPTNKLKFWICWEGWEYDIKVIKSVEEKYNIKQSFDGLECLPPNEEKEVWILFKEYNELDEEQRLGEWRIKPTVKLKNVKCYTEGDLNLISSCLTRPEFSGNEQKLTIVKEEPTTYPEAQAIWRWLTTGYNIIIALGALVGALATIAGAIYAIRRFIRRL